MFIETLLSEKVEHLLFYISWWSFYEWHTIEVFGFQLPFSDQGEGGDVGVDAENNNSLKINDEH